MVGTFSPSPARQLPLGPNSGQRRCARRGLPYASVLAITIAGSTVTRTVAAGTEPSG